MDAEVPSWLTPKVLKFLKTSIEQQAREMRHSRQKLLLDLSNVDVGSTRMHKRLEQFDPQPTPSQISKVQAELRSIWSDFSQAPSTGTPILEHWLFSATQGLLVPESLRITKEKDLELGEYKLQGDISLIPNWRTGQIEFAPSNFLGQLVTAVLENWRDFRVCGNPECAAKFFYAKRRNQRYCERGDCSKYAQQQHALKWWRENRQKKGGKK
jgi:hypothetical protein